MDLRELNYILIPRSNDTWEAWAQTRSGRVLTWLAAPLLTLTREGQVVAVATLVGGAAGVDVGGSHLYLVFAGLISLLTVAFALRRMARLDGLQVSVERPDRVEAGLAATLTVVLHNAGTRPRFALRIHGPFLPWDGRWVGAPGAVAELPVGATVRVPLQVRFLCRGDRLVGRLSVVSVRPLGLAQGRPVRTDSVRVTVVPRRVNVPTPPPRPAGGAAGTARRQAVGVEQWAGVRPYRAGDRLRDLHARSWARLGEPMVRVFEAPQRPVEQVLVVPQVRRNEREGFDAALGIAAGLLHGVVGRDAVGTLSVLGADAGRALAVGRGVAGLERALDRLATVEPAAAKGVWPAPAPGSAGEPLCVVFGGWGPEAAVFWRGLQRSRPGARAWVVSRHRAERADAAAQGVEALSLDQARAGVPP